MDTNLRDLQRSDKPLDRYKWRLAMIRAGQPLKPEVGDLIEVDGHWHGCLEWIEWINYLRQPRILVGLYFSERNSIAAVETTLERIKVIEPVRPE